MAASGAQGLHALIDRQARDFAAWPTSGERLVDETTCLAAVLLAIAAAREMGLANVGWAAFSAYMVIRPSLGESLYRASARVLGTAAGVTLACLLAPGLLRSTLWLGTGLALFGALTLYLALLDRRTYGCLFAGMAFAMVLIDGMAFPGEALGALARVRFLDVCIGSGAALLVSAVARFRPWRRVAVAHGGGQDEAPGQRRASLRLWHPVAFRRALQGAVALALIPWVWHAFHVQSLSQSSTTIMAVMMVPLAASSAPSQPASRKMRHRFVGGAIGAAVGLAILLMSHASPVVTTLAICLGVPIGRHVENGTLGIGYVGTQFALAFLVVLVPDSYAVPDVQPGLSRLSGILMGMALLEPVRLLFKKILPSD